MAEEVLQWVVPMLAGYGAALSTYNAWSARRQRERGERRVLELKATYAWPVGEDGIDGEWITVTATNVGRRAVVADRIELELPDGDHCPKITIGPHDTRFPVTLTDGQSAAIHYDVPNLQAVLYRHRKSGEAVALTPVCKDSLGHKHAGKPITIEPTAAE